MFNISSTEIAFIAVVALLVLGPKKLPELARGIGKFMRDFRQKTNEVRNVVEREFYRMDQEVLGADTAPKIAAADGSVAASPGDDDHHEDWKPDPGQAAAAAAPDGSAAPAAGTAAAPAEPQLEKAAEDYGDGLSPHDEGEPPPADPPPGETPPVSSPAVDSQLTAGMPKTEPAADVAPVDPPGTKS